MRRVQGTRNRVMLQVFHSFSFFVPPFLPKCSFHTPRYCNACEKPVKGVRLFLYRSSCKRYNLHVACVREMVVECWLEGGGFISVVEGQRV